ncbi:hypothetical protein HaLaN_06650 [Haematococcus lacustris]|uniref:Uncharacterized protein n=1 Tax=Haematococcus lacustris TaxID=44745 RepID=A0A699YXC7_HAELA|nr:hypothetical protein HaLaN_06650 [Haematococcus lacustris]
MQQAATPPGLAWPMGRMGRMSELDERDTHTGSTGLLRCRVSSCYPYNRPDLTWGYLRSTKEVCTLVTPRPSVRAAGPARVGCWQMCICVG